MQKCYLLSMQLCCVKIVLCCFDFIAKIKVFSIFCYKIKLLYFCFFLTENESIFDCFVTKNNIFDFMYNKKLVTIFKLKLNFFLHFYNIQKTIFWFFSKLNLNVLFTY